MSTRSATFPFAEASSQAESALVIASSGRPDLDGFHFAALRFYLAGLAHQGEPLPAVFVCDPEHVLHERCGPLLGLAAEPPRIKADRSPPIDVLHELTAEMHAARILLRWLAGITVKRVLIADGSGLAQYASALKRLGLGLLDVRFELVATGLARDYDHYDCRHPDFADLGRYHMEMEARRGADGLWLPALAASGSRSGPLKSLALLLAGDGVRGIGWFARVLAQLPAGVVPESISLLRVGDRLTAEQRRASAALAAAVRRPLRFLAGHGERPDLPQDSLAVVVGPSDQARLLCAMASSWGLPVLSATADPDEPAHLPHAPGLAAMRVATVFAEGMPLLGSTWVRKESGKRPRAAAPPLGDPAVTICLVTYNRPQLLREAVESLQAQTSDAFEVVILDDGSRDAAAIAYLDTLERTLPTERWRVIRQPNAYLGAARNNAAKAARGSYLLFMDDDNLAKPQMVERFLAAARHSGADLLTSFCDCFRTYRHGRPLVHAQRLFLGGATALGTVVNVFGDANALVRKTFFDDMGGFTEDAGITHEDWEFFIRAVQRGGCLEVLPEALFYYRVGADSMIKTTDQWRNMYRSIRAYQEGEGDQGAALFSAYAQTLVLRRWWG